MREVDINDTELANGDDDGWLAVVLANRLPVFDEATGNACATWPASSTSKASSPRCRAPKPPAEGFRLRARAGLDRARVDRSERRARSARDGRHRHWAASCSRTPDLRLPRCRARGGGATRGCRREEHAAVRRLARRHDGDVSEHAACGAQWASATAQVNNGRARPGRQATRPRHDGQWFSLPDRAVRDREGASLSGARALVVHHEGATFETLMQDLDVGLLGTRVDRAGRGAARPIQRSAAGPPAARTGGRRDRPHRPRSSHAPRRHDARLVPRAVRAVSDHARLPARRRAAAARARRRPIADASSPMAAKTSRSPRPSRSGDCSDSRSCRSCPR